MENLSDKKDPLRKNAEAWLAHTPSAGKTPLSADKLLHELQVHQIELKMQNDELRRSQASLEESRDRYLEFYEFAPAGYLTLSHHGVIDEINLTCAAMLGVARKNLLTRRFSRLIAPEDQDRWHSHFISALNNEEKYSCDLALRRGDGSRFYVQMDCLRRIEPGKGTILHAVMTDITERKKLEKTVVNNEKEFRLLAEAMPQLVWITRPDGWNIYFNRQWMDYTGLPLEESYGHGWSKPFHPEDKPFAWEAWQHAVNNKCAYSVESRLRRQDGEYRWWLIRGVPVLDEAGNICKWFGTCTDIHDIKRAENELRAAAINEREITARNIQLTQEVSRRNADLSALTAHIHKIAEAERASLARELHDEMGSILTGLSMAVGRLKRKISDPDLSQDIAKINGFISATSKIKENIIKQLYPTVLDDYGFVAAIEWLVKEFKSGSEIEVELLLPEEVAMEPVFALAAYRITQECLTNIAKHAGASKVRIEIKASDGFLDLTIHDNGKGMRSEISVNRHGIFGMIERARYLEGSLDIRSEPGKGTTAHLSLPLAAAKPKNKKKVLVVDDHALIRDAIRQLIHTQTDEFSVEGEAADGIAAIEMAIKDAWDIMLLDISLPKKNGMEVLEAIKEVKPDLPIIMLSTYAKDKYAGIALEKGAADYIEKGKTDKLVEAMRKVSH